MSRSRHHRKAVSVLTEPVGARMSALSPRAMTGQPIFWGDVGSSKTSLNHSAVTGWKSANGSGIGFSDTSGLGRRGDMLSEHTRDSSEEEAKRSGARVRFLGLGID